MSADITYFFRTGLGEPTLQLLGMYVEEVRPHISEYTYDRVQELIQELIDVVAADRGGDA